MPKKNNSFTKENDRFKLNLIGENNKIQFIGSTPGTILTLLCTIMCIIIFANLVISMESGEKDTIS